MVFHSLVLRNTNSSRQSTIMPVWVKKAPTNTKTAMLRLRLIKETMQNMTRWTRQAQASTMASYTSSCEILSPLRNIENKIAQDRIKLAEISSIPWRLNRLPSTRIKSVNLFKNHYPKTTQIHQLGKARDYSLKALTKCSTFVISCVKSLKIARKKHSLCKINALGGYIFTHPSTVSTKSANRGNATPT